MANKDDDLVLSVGAEANVDSAKKATKDLEKGVLSSLKDGYIPVPVELKTSIKGASKDLKAAQEEVITQWEKTFSKGFSSSRKDLDKLSGAYTRFKKLADTENKTGSKQYKGILAMMDKPVQDYRAKRNERLMTKLKENKETKVTQTKGTKAKPISTGTKKEKRGKYAGLGSIKKELGYPTKSLDTSTSTQRDLDASNKFGPYENKSNRQTNNSIKETRAHTKESLKTRRINEKDTEDLLSKKEQLAKNMPSTKQANIELSGIASEKILETMYKLARGKITGDNFLDTSPAYIKEIFARNEKAGKNSWDSIRQAVDTTFGGLFPKGGFIGLAKDNSIADLLNEEDVLNFIKKLFRGINRVKDVKGKYGMTAEEASILGALKDIDYNAQYKEVSRLMAEQVLAPMMEHLNKIKPDTSMNFKTEVMDALLKGMAEEESTDGNTVASQVSKVNDAVDHAADVMTKELSATRKNQDVTEETLAAKINKALTETGFSDGKFPYQNALYSIAYNLNLIRDAVETIRDRNGGGRRKSWW